MFFLIKNIINLIYNPKDLIKNSIQSKSGELKSLFNLSFLILIFASINSYISLFMILIGESKTYLIIIPCIFFLFLFILIILFETAFIKLFAKSNFISTREIFLITSLSYYPYLLLISFSIIALSIDSILLYFILYLGVFIWSIGIKYNLIQNYKPNFTQSIIFIILSPFLIQITFSILILLYISSIFVTFMIEILN